MNAVKPILRSNTKVFNPYPVLGCPIHICWPRGFPLNEIQNPSTWQASSEDSTTQLNSFGVLQSLADVQPDVDAIFRMTQETPFVFQKTKYSSKYEIGILLHKINIRTKKSNIATNFDFLKNHTGMDLTNAAKNLLTWFGWTSSNYFTSFF